MLRLRHCRSHLLLFMLTLGLDSRDTTRLGYLARVLVNGGRVGIRLFLLPRQVLLFSIALALHLLHALLIGAIEVTNVHLLAGLVQLTLRNLLFFTRRFLSQLGLAFLSKLLKFHVARIQRLLIPLVRENRCGLLLLSDLGAFLIDLGLEARLG